MALDFLDRLLTIVVTATLTSAGWIVVGSSYIDRDEDALPVAAPTARTAEGTTEAPPAVRSAGPLTIPVAGVVPSQLTDTFNQTRGVDRRHEALDIMAPTGTPVIAAAGGTIEKLFRSDAGGNTVYVRSADRRTLYYYAHLQAYAGGLEEGMAVERGERLGTVGSTGNADPAAPHLHFAILRTTPDNLWWEPATAINPYPLLVAAR